MGLGQAGATAVRNGILPDAQSHREGHMLPGPARQKALQFAVMGGAPALPPISAVTWEHLSILVCKMGIMSNLLSSCHQL